jgi:hypothetical protein
MAKDNAFGFEQPSKTGSEQDDLRSTLAWITLDFTILFFLWCFIDLVGFKMDPNGTRRGLCRSCWH